MPKYKNVKEFVQPLTINGKRSIVRPGEVVYVAKELDLEYAPFLELVPDTTPISTPTAVRPTVKTVATPDIDALKKSIELLQKNTVSLDAHEKSKGTTEEQMKLLQDEIGVVLKRLEVLKGAVETVNQALRNVEEVIYNSEEFVIVDDPEPKGK